MDAYNIPAASGSPLGSDVSTPPTNAVLQCADQILVEAAKRGLILKLSGGVGCWMRCPNTRTRQPYASRLFSDIDWIALSRQRAGINRMFRDLGYREDPRIAAIPGLRRSLFRHSEEVRCDVFYDVLEFCHTIDLRKRLSIDWPSISLADLLLQKLQIVDLTTKDVTDICLLLVEHEVSAEPESIDSKYISELCSKDWGLWRTLMGSLERLTSFSELDVALSDMDRATIGRRCRLLQEAIDRTAKAVRWHLRALLGERIKWYETVDEIGNY